MLIDTSQLVTAVEAAALCDMGKRNFHKLYPKTGAVPIGGRPFYRREDVIEWNRNRLLSLTRRWKRHKEWEERIGS